MVDILQIYTTYIHKLMVKNPTKIFFLGVKWEGGKGGDFFFFFFLSTFLLFSPHNVNVQSQPQSVFFMTPSPCLPALSNTPFLYINKFFFFFQTANLFSFFNYALKNVRCLREGRVLVINNNYKYSVPNE